MTLQTLSEDGHTEEVQETLVIPTLNNKGNKEESVISERVEDESDDKSPSESIVFEIDFGNGEFQQPVWRKDEDFSEITSIRKASLFSDDEFEPIRMKLPKRRTPLPLRLSNHKVEKCEVQAPPPSCESPTSSLTSDDSGHSGSSKDASLDHPQGLSPGTMVPSPTLFSVNSASSSSTCLDSAACRKSPGHDQTFRGYEKDLGSTKFIEIVTPDSVPETRGLVDLRAYGYDFGWSRFAGRSEAPHGLSPEDSAELEMFLSRVCSIQSRFSFLY